MRRKLLKPPLPLFLMPPEMTDPNQSMPDNKSPLAEDLKEYVRLQLSLLKLTLVEKLSRITAFMLLIVLIVLLLSLSFFYLSFAALGWIAVLLGSRELALLLFGLFFLFLALILYLNRGKWFVNGFVKVFSRIIFDDKNEEE